MLLSFFFKNLPLTKQVNYLKKKGIGLGTRLKDGRKIYIYMLRDLFIEVLYVNDNSENIAERLNVISGVVNLNKHLENEFRNTF
ncbi:MAG TPA: hypothetical protein VGK59_17810 [Ohtaekwangia sp.]